MSQENVEIVRPIYDDAAEGRFGRHMHLFDPDVEYARKRQAADLLSGEWHGLQAMSDVLREWMETVDELQVEAERYIDAGDSVVVLTRSRAINKASGIPLDERFADVITLRDGRIVRWHSYRHPSEALEAVGVRE